MGTSASTQRRLYRSFDASEFTVAWLTFKGDAIDDQEQHYVVKKEGLVSSKLLRGLFGEMTMQCFEDVRGDTISKAAFVCILALFYDGKTEDRISYIFTMYNIISTGETNGEGCIAEKDYLCLLGYLEEHTLLPKKLYAAFEECKIPMAGVLSYSQFATWMRLHTDVVEFLAVHLQPSVLTQSPLASSRNIEESVSNSDHSSDSPSCRDDLNKNVLSSFDFVGGGDSGDEDSDGFDDSDHLTEMEISQSSFHDSISSMNENDELTSTSNEASAAVRDDNGKRASDVSSSERQRTDAVLPVSAPGLAPPPEDPVAQSRRGRRRPGIPRSRGVQKMGRYMGKAVGGGISKVGHVGRSILHVGKSQGLNQQHGCDQQNDDSATAICASHSFSSESQSTRKYVCGYLHKISDSKWGTKRSWHRRWFVLDRQRGVLSYYRHNPANHMPSSLANGNIVHMSDAAVPTGKDAAADSNNRFFERRRQSSGAPPNASCTPSGRTDDDDGNHDHSGCLSGLTANEAESAIQHDASIEEQTNSRKPQESDQVQEQPQHLLYLNETHAWYRGALDLNAKSVSLLFEKTLARNAPTHYFFQVSTLSLHDIDTKRGVQYKLCADTESDFDIWTSAIAEVVNGKDGRNDKAIEGTPFLSHQQLYRQRLLQEQMEAEKMATRDSEGGPDEVADTSCDSPPAPGERLLPSSHGIVDGQRHQVPINTAPAPPVKRKAPPRIVTQFPAELDSSVRNASCWYLHLHVDGTKQCLIVGFMLNIVAIRCLASEHVLWKVAVCLAVSVVFVLSVYNPRPLHHPCRGSMRSIGKSTGYFDKALLGADVAQCRDPVNCCIHKASSSAGADQGNTDDQCMDGSDDEPHRRSSRTGDRGSAKLPMSNTMSRCKVQENGQSSNVEHSCTRARAETFAVRSANYKKSRKKEPSKPALFEFIGADLVRTDCKLDRISQHVEFPPPYDTSRLFVINIQLPSYGPSMWGDGTYDGPGYSLALYWKIPDDIVKDLENPTSTTVKLLKCFLEAGSDTSVTDRFKIIAQVTNQDECGITGVSKRLLVSHNATPVLTRPQHRIYHFRDGSTEVVVDMHAFSYVARRGIYSLLDKTSRLVIDFAFVVQGETDEELPEQVLGCCRLNRINVHQAGELPC
uniref:PH domain-containing protein n=1 Tax=Peronospora matthiolae TaxID=2874970 RepID=A0AAV1UVI1_9STRA